MASDAGASLQDDDPVRWQFETDRALSCGPTVVDGKVFVTRGLDSESTLLCLSASDGEVLWERETDVRSSGEPLVVDGVVFHHDKARDADTGAVLWEQSGIWDGGMTFAEGRLFNSDVAIDASNGDIDWWYEDDFAPLHPVVNDGQVFGTSSDGTVYAVDTTSGETNWSVETDRRLQSLFTVANGALVVYDAGEWKGEREATVIAFDEHDGERLWTTTHDHLRNDAPTSDDDRLFLRDTNDVYAFDIGTGNVEWIYPDAGDNEHDPRSGAGVTVADGVVYTKVGDFDGDRIVGIDAASGELVFDYPVPSELSGHDQGLIVADGVLYTSIQGSVAALDVPTDASSSGSRTHHAVTNHHGDWRNGDATIGVDADVSSTDVSIENVRFVQAVEDTRVFEADADRLDWGKQAPAAKEFRAGVNHPDVERMEPNPAFVQGKATAPVFDVNAADPDQHEELTVTARLAGAEESPVERSMTFDTAAIAGELSPARRGQLEARGIDPDNAPLLEVFNDEPEHFRDEYPTFPMASGLDVELEVDGPALDESVVEVFEIDPDDVRTTPQLAVGFVGVEHEGLTGTYSFGDDAPTPVEFAESTARILNATFPTVGVDVAVLSESIDGTSALNPGKVESVAKDANAAMAGAIDDAESFRITNDGIYDPSRDVSSVDVTIAVVPGEGFFGELPELIGTDGGGGIPLVGDTNVPVTDAVLVENGNETTAAHELGHYFLGAFYDEELANDGTDLTHATQRIVSVGYDVKQGGFEVLPGRKSLMSYGTTSWIDGVTYDALIDSGFDAVSDDTDTVAQWTADVSGGIEDVRRSFERAPATLLDEVDDTDVRNRLESLDDDFDDIQGDSRGTWDADVSVDEQQLEEAREISDDAAAVATGLQERDGTMVDDRVGTAPALGREIEQRVTGLREALNRYDGEVEYVVDLGSHFSESELEDFDLQTQVRPVVESPSQVAGSGSVTVRDSAGTVLEEAPVATSIDVLGQEGRTTVEGVLHGTARLPEDAVSVEVAVEQDDDKSDTDGGNAERVYTFHPATDPIRDRVEALPERAFADPDRREGLLGDLDTVETRIGEGDRSGAVELLTDTYRSLFEGIEAGYEPERDGEPAQTDVLSAVAVQIQRFGGTVPDLESDDGESGFADTWLAGGAVAGGLVVGGAALYKYWGGDVTED